ncbi:MAG TPA: GNAT family protein [Solirubrobacterales bacterium]|nr:GNAT family protein [Solirubrobacterales bacterium]
MALSPRLDSLGIRPLLAADAPELHSLVEANRHYLAQWLPWAADQDLAATKEFLAGAEAQLARNDGFQAAIAPEGPIVGVAGFHSVDWTNRNTSIGYWLAEDAQGCGTMTTTVRALVDHAFSEWNLHRVEIHCAPANHRSRAIPERLGFREEATLRETELVGDRYLDSVVYGLLESEWSGG